MANIFTKHPRSMNETYLEHLYHASRFGVKMLTAGTACMLHAIFPFLFKNTASNFLLSMMHDYVSRAPKVEQRVDELSQTIIQKKSSCDAACGRA